MVLKQLEIQGFKSFPDRTRILIEPGITAVVGPNGSGKSNISDAIRWVLGETSSRQLRGSGKMEDVIFGGTQMRGAMGFASVALTVNISDRRLDIDADEVVIGRKYYRSGESEYTLNGQAVRLKDIYELLWIPAWAAMDIPLSARAVLLRLLAQKVPNEEKFLKKPAALPNIATAKMRPSTALPLPRKIWSACAIFWAS